MPRAQANATGALPVMAAALTLFVAAAPLPTPAQTPLAIDPTGGLRDAADTTAAAAGLTREELVRKWDTDGNGTIDDTEAAVARARMRRSRLETHQSAAIDPLTGRSRGAEAAEEPVVQAEPPPQPRKRPTDGPALPGTRVPDTRPATPARTSSSSTPAGNSGPAGPAVPGSAPRHSTGATTGGVRAGAPAARPGYGALKPGNDQAARSPDKTGSGRTPKTAAAVPDGRGGSFRGGLVPAARPGRIPRPRGPLPAPSGRPESPTPRTPRLSADEIGGF